MFDNLPSYYTRDINKLQQNIMSYINLWIKKHKTIIPQREIINYMETYHIKDCTTVSALNVLMRKGYIQRVKMYSAQQGNSGYKTYYKQLRTI